MDASAAEASSLPKPKQPVDVKLCDANGGCSRPAQKGGKCWAHIKRRQRNSEAAGPVREYGLPGQELLGLAAARYGNAEDDEAFRLAKEQLRKYAVRAVERRRPDNVHLRTHPRGHGRGR